MKNLRAICGSVVLILLLVSGCKQSLETAVTTNESSLNRLINSARNLQEEVTKSRGELQKQISEYDELLKRLNDLLNTPQPVPPVPPGPAPLPNPNPVVPTPLPPGPKVVDGRFGVAVAVCEIAKQVQSPNRVEECKGLAANFRSVASKVQAGSLNGTLITPQAKLISNELTAGNKLVLSRNLPQWAEPAKQLGSAIAKRYSDGVLKSNQDWADLLNEIAIGLEGSTL